MIEMRNYLFSIAVHIVLLLILLGFSLSSVKKDPEKVDNVIMVDFSKSAETPRPAKAERAKTKSPLPPKPNISSPPKGTTEEKPQRVKVYEKKTLQSSQKPKAESSKTLQDEAPIVKKIIPPLEEKPNAEELAELEREKKKATKLSEFTSLLSKAKKSTATEEDQLEKNDKSSSDVQNTSTGISTHKNIQGVLGNRKVLKSPVIKDQSQKKGRVVVKICVGSDGKVMSSQYTMMGSTTNDSYLIGLAEKGAKEYLFSASPNPKECGKVIIDFQLK